MRGLRWLFIVIGVAFLIWAIVGCSDGLNYEGNGNYVQETVSRVVRVIHKVKVRMAENQYRRLTMSGTGCIVGNNLVLTAKHVVELKQLPVSTPFGVFYVPVKVVWERTFVIVNEDGLDVAYPVVKIRKNKNIDAVLLKTAWKLPNPEPIRIGNSARLRRGDRVFVLGLPFYNEAPFYREGAVSNRGHRNIWLFTELRIIPGYSGSPVFAVRYGKPELIGIATGMIIAYGIPDVSVVVPINRIRRLLKW